MICKGYAETNIKFLRSYDADKPGSYVIYLDANNLYGHCTTEIRDLVNPKYFNLDNYSNDSPINSFLEIDFDYPDELHNLHNDYPSAGEKIKVREELMSDLN